MGKADAKNSGAKEAPSSVATPQHEEPMVFAVGCLSLTEIEPGETHSDIGLDCEKDIPWGSQHLSKFACYFETREDGRAAVAFALANELVDDLKKAITLQAQAESERPPA